MKYFIFFVLHPSFFWFANTIFGAGAIRTGPSGQSADAGS
jgi:hypothetical protein